jgi:hypothetical protein
MDIAGHDELNTFNRNQISSILQTERGLRVKLVCKEKPAEDAALTTASLEDACLYCISLQGGGQNA